MLPNSLQMAILMILFATISHAWQTSRITDDGFYSADPSIAVSGDTIAIAYESYAYGNDEIILKYSTDKGSTYSSPIRISFNDSTSWRPKVTINDGFDIVWEDKRSGKRQIFYSRYSNGSSTTNLRISSGNGAAAFPAMASDNNNLFLVWEDNRDGNDEIYFRKFDSGAWSAEKRITFSDSTSWGATVAYDKSSDYLHLAYFDYSTGNDEIYYTFSTDRGASWSNPVNVSNDAADSWEPRIAAFNGTVAIVWYSYSLSNSSYEVYFSELSGDSFSSPLMISSAGSDSKCPSISIGDKGIHVAWEDFRDGNDEIYVASRAIGSTSIWTEERVTTDPADSFGASIASDNSNVYVSWFDYRDKVDQIYAAQKTILISAEKRSKDQLSPHITISPNPFNNRTSVVAHGISGQICYKLSDISGKPVVSGKSNDKRNFYIQDVDLPNGLYILTISGSNKTVSSRINIIK